MSVFFVDMVVGRVGAGVRVGDLQREALAISVDLGRGLTGIVLQILEQPVVIAENCQIPVRRDLAGYFDQGVLMRGGLIGQIAGRIGVLEVDQGAGVPTVEIHVAGLVVGVEVIGAPTAGSGRKFGAAVRKQAFGKTC